MQIGDLRHLITIQEPVDVSDGQGGFTRTWSFVDKVWSHIEPLSSVERFQAQGLMPTVTHQIVIRYRSDITTKNRLLHGTRVFNIMGLYNADERDYAIVMHCEEVV